MIFAGLMADLLDPTQTMHATTHRTYPREVADG
jgi:hypothetical protein